MTIRDIPDNVAVKIASLANKNHMSRNSTVIDILSKGTLVGIHQGPKRDLSGLFGDWTDKDEKEFEVATAMTRKVDEEMWR